MTKYTYRVLSTWFCIAVFTTFISACEADGSRPLDDIIGTIGDDAPLSLRVRIALQESPSTRRLNIDVSTLDDGTTVRLAGFVNNEAEAHEAERIASQVDGVVHVANTLSIR